MAFAGEPYALTAAPIATSYSTVSKIGYGAPLAYSAPLAAPLAASPIAYKTASIPIVSSYPYGASIAAPLAYKAPIATSYGYGIGSPILAGGYIGAKYY